MMTSNAQKTTQVTIITPCYNGARTVARCIECMLRQNYPNLEWIFVDDGSSDNSREILFSYKERLTSAGIRLNYIYQKNQGPASAIQTGLKAVTGEYLGLLDIDDEYFQHSIARKAAYLDGHSDMDIIFSNGYSVYDNGTKVLFAPTPISMDNLFDNLVTGTQYNWSGSYMVRAEKLFSFYNDHTFYISRHGQHLQILMPLAYYGKAGYIHEPLMHYFRSKQSLSKVGNAYEQRLEVIMGYEDIRLHVVQIIVPAHEYERYETMVKTLYTRERMKLAYMHHKHAEVKKDYKALKAIGAIRRGDRLLYACSLYPLVEPLYNTALKLRRIVKADW